MDELPTAASGYLAVKFLLTISSVAEFPGFGFAST